MELRNKIKETLTDIVTNWHDEGYRQLSVSDAGFLLANGSCLLFAKEAVNELDKRNIVLANNITVIQWMNESKCALAHVILVIDNYIYDSNIREGYEYSRDALNTIFLRHAAGAKLIWKDCGIIVEEGTNKIIYNPWPKEGVVYMPYTEIRTNGSILLKK